MHISAEELKKNAQLILSEIKDKSLSNKERTAIPLQEMPAQDPKVRINNMEEVAQGYSREQALVESRRCLQCASAPCVEGCPVQINIPGFIKAIEEENFEKSIGVIKEASLLPSICGRVCPQESQCQEKCTVGKIFKDPNKSVSIGRLERFVADWEASEAKRSIPEIKPSTGKKVAVIGSGPAGITAAADIAKEGHEVVVFEAFHKPGGVMIYGIPEFRLPKKIVEDEIETLKKMNVTIKQNFLVGRSRTLKDLLEKDGFSAVFIGTGAGLPKFMGIEGENLVGVFSANEYLTRSNLMKAYKKDTAATPIYPSKKVMVFGGGNVAMDAARTAIRLGAEEVSIVYRRTEAEMPARIEEVAHAKEEGIKFRLLENASKIIGDEKGRVKAVELVTFELGEPDASGRRRPVQVKGSEHLVEADTVIV
ncbi:MAG TPA: NADPH-dependent glutamate synthase, partial [Spirochaetota bacterium]|nr:NADPH-dependent glutamate synthase [Spirochaetota bacterium]